MRLFPIAALLALVLSSASAVSPQAGNVIFIHPDGTSLNTWNAARLLLVGPDGLMEWDQLPQVGLYRSHYKDSLAPTSHGGGTVHAWGVKVNRDSYGLDGQNPIRARSGSTQSLMHEAKSAGLAVGIVQTGHLAEPGTGVFLASSAQRSDYTGIAEKIIASGADIILAGGEIYLLPTGQTGRHGEPGVRTDNRNLVSEARAAGYTVVYDRRELAAAAADPGVKKLFGVFAAKDTFNYDSEEKLAASGLPLYLPEAPTVAEMTDAALQVCTRLGRRFFLVVEEEGTDNLANVRHASGTFEALRRADAAIGVARQYLHKHPQTLLVTAADSDAGALQVINVGPQRHADEPPPLLKPTTSIGGPIDGVNGPGTAAFLSLPDRAGQRFWFGAGWGAADDMLGAVVARAAGLNAERLPLNVDNTGIYVLMWETLFGRPLPAP